MKCASSPQKITSCMLIRFLKTVQWKVQCWKEAFPKWELIYSGQFVGRSCLIPVYLTSLLYYFSRPLYLVGWFCWQWERVAFVLAFIHWDAHWLECLASQCIIEWPCLNLWDKRHSKNQNALHIFSSVWLEISRVACEMIVPYHIWWLTSLTTVLSCIRRAVWL